MSAPSGMESMLDVYIFETEQNIEQLEQIILSSEKSGSFTADEINEIFRIMHTIKGSSAMMNYSNISSFSHSLEDVFYYLRENHPEEIDYDSLTDLIFEGIDFIKLELDKIKSGSDPDGDAEGLNGQVRNFLQSLKEPPDHLQMFKALIRFEEGCEMENIRAYTVVHHLQDLVDEVLYEPKDILENNDSSEVIKEHGFQLYIKTSHSFDEINDFLNQTIFLQTLEFSKVENRKDYGKFTEPTKDKQGESVKEKPRTTVNVHDNSQEPHAVVQQNLISVNVEKLDQFMDLVGELVIAEAMVTHNPDLNGLELDNFSKAARQLQKITTELQDIAMSIRMVPLASTFHKMNRIVRDMCKKLDKDVELVIIGEEIEVDKNIIEHISDPLMHLVRNAIDHGIEPKEERQASGKTEPARVILEAKNSGSDVLVQVKDNGKGLLKERILQKAREHNLLYKPEQEMTDREIYHLILLPGFSTNEQITEYSGRGVGMDVVTKNIESIGGSVLVDSAPNEGTTITLKIPLTLAIIDGMNLRVGKSRYTIPTTAIKESFRPLSKDVIIDPDGNEMIMVRGECFPIIRLHALFGVDPDYEDFEQGIFLMIEYESKFHCLFADELLGKQQVVVKSLPKYITNIRKIKGLAGCTLLGDGSISLILNLAGII